MSTDRDGHRFWTRWLLAVSAGVAAFGLLLVLAPGVVRGAFGLMLYADAGRIAAFGRGAAAYVDLAHAVLGSVMFGWGIALCLVVRSLFARGDPAGWWIVAVSVGAWFVPDTVFSLRSGFWPNAVLNTTFLVLYAIPLVATRSMPAAARHPEV